MEKEDMKIEYNPIGVIHSPFKEAKGMPVQPSGAAGVKGTVEIFPEFAEGLKDLDGFSHIYLIYHFHQSIGYSLVVTPFMDTDRHGVFATRAPRRPNPVGISVVKLNKIDGPVLSIENVDILDGTPLLDIKPYVPDFDDHPADSTGWLEKARGASKTVRSDGRFT
ncbi:MAG: tRNA (N6-threonylcarbamoyladenosine(37)-N6)-methyltransferase TrmO [Bacteriovoracaceae bacterium]|jgi:tRNA-Thr(GGU) m(6)t(6)A37 methyltransferase TsaA|nr:tRNA (N6-threonylcarbamoyladenosine(37)-N6)-methyltransferase TrmO [Bacteriovoracaceae bacterium]